VERHRLGLAAKGFTKPSVLDGREVLHQPKQARPRWGDRSSHLLLVEALELPQDHVAVPVEADEKTFLLTTSEGHALTHARTVAAAPTARASSLEGSVRGRRNSTNGRGRTLAR